MQHEYSNYRQYLIAYGMWQATYIGMVQTRGKPENCGLYQERITITRFLEGFFCAGGTELPSGSDVVSLYFMLWARSGIRKMV